MVKKLEIIGFGFDKVDGREQRYSIEADKELTFEARAADGQRLFRMCIQYIPRQPRPYRVILDGEPWKQFTDKKKVGAFKRKADRTLQEYEGGVIDEEEMDSE